MKKLLTTYLICLSFTTLYAQKRIFGKVVDKNQNPLIGASVYINNTSIGTTTDEKGEFYLYVHDGYDLVASYLGFYTSKLKLTRKNMANYIVFKLNPKVSLLEEVVIKKKKKLPNSKRSLYIRMFKRHFLGITNASKKCEIMNDSVLIFDFDNKAKNLEVSSSGNIVIKNTHLGYELSYDLIHFLLEPERVTYLGFSRYKELEGTKKQQKRWKKNRLRAYKGSFRHFLKTIIDDTNLRKEGFVVDHFKLLPNPDRPSEEQIQKARLLVKKKGRLQRNPFHTDIQLDLNLDTARKILKDATLDPFIEKVTKEVLESHEFTKYDAINKKFSLKFTDFLRVTYLKESEEKRFRREDIKRLSYQISHISMYVPETSIVKFKGVLEEPLDVLLEQYWGYEKMADALPLDYFPPK